MRSWRTARVACADAPFCCDSQDVPSLGSAGEIVDVSPGHARNYLVPGRMAVPVRAPGRGRGAAAQAAAQQPSSAPRAAAAAGAGDPSRLQEEALEAVRRLTVAPLVRPSRGAPCSATLFAAPSVLRRAPPAPLARCCACWSTR